MFRTVALLLLFTWAMLSVISHSLLISPNTCRSAGGRVLSLNTTFGEQRVCYVLNLLPRTWDGALASCRSIAPGFDLVSFRSRAEYNLVVDDYLSLGPLTAFQMWVGMLAPPGTEELREFFYTDGTSNCYAFDSGPTRPCRDRECRPAPWSSWCADMSWNPWREDQPDNFHINAVGSENCTQLTVYPTQEGLNDLECTASLVSLCKAAVAPPHSPSGVVTVSIEECEAQGGRSTGDKCLVPAAEYGRRSRLGFTPQAAIEHCRSRGMELAKLDSLLGVQVARQLLRLGLVNPDWPVLTQANVIVDRRRVQQLDGSDITWGLTLRPRTEPRKNNTWAVFNACSLFGEDKQCSPDDWTLMWWSERADPDTGGLTALCEAKSSCPPGQRLANAVLNQAPLVAECIPCERGKFDAEFTAHRECSACPKSTFCNVTTGTAVPTSCAAHPGTWCGDGTKVPQPCANPEAAGRSGFTEASCAATAYQIRLGTLRVADGWPVAPTVRSLSLGDLSPRSPTIAFEAWALDVKYNSANLTVRAVAHDGGSAVDCANVRLSAAHSASDEFFTVECDLGAHAAGSAVLEVTRDGAQASAVYSVDFLFAPTPAITEIQDVLGNVYTGSDQFVLTDRDEFVFTVRGDQFVEVGYQGRVFMVRSDGDHDMVEITNTCETLTTQTIACRWTTPQPGDWLVSVTQGNVHTPNSQSATTTVTMVVPTTAVVTSVSGCAQDNGWQAVGCPAVGGVVITVRGRYFGNPSDDGIDPMVFVGPLPCVLLPGWNKSYVECQLPRTVGVSKAALSVVSQVHRDLPARPSALAVWVIYAPLEVTQLEPSSDSECEVLGRGTRLAGCRRSGNFLLTIRGRNFGGARLVSVYIGDDEAEVLLSQPEKAIVTVPPGGSELQRVLVQDGSRSDSSTYIEYKPCSAGTQEGESPGTCTPCSLGTASALPGSVCIKCAPGRYQNERGKSSCKDCLPNSVAPERGATECDLCEPGSHAPDPGMRRCTQCASGFAATKGEPCTACEPGYYEELNRFCRGTKPGYFASGFGNTAPVACPAGRFAPTERLPSCLPCRPQEYAPGANSTSCESCPVGRYADEPGRVTCSLCSASQYLFQPPGMKRSQCLQCERGSHCDDGVLTAADGYYMLQRSPADKPKILPCRPKVACKKGNACDKNRLKPYSANTLCAKCEEGHVQLGSGECVACSSVHWPNLALVLLFFHAVVGVMKIATGRTALSAAPTMTLFFFGQMASVAFEYSVLSWLRLDPSGYMCVWPYDPNHQLVAGAIEFAVLLGAFTTFVVINAIMFACDARATRKNVNCSAFFRTFAAVVQQSFVVVAQSWLASLHCESETGESRVARFPAVLCDDLTWERSVTTSAFVVVVVSIAVIFLLPVCGMNPHSWYDRFGWMNDMFRHTHKPQNASSSSDTVTTESSEDSRSEAAESVDMATVDPRRYTHTTMHKVVGLRWWFVSFTVMRLAVVFIAEAVSDETDQLAALVILFSLFLCATVHGRPFKSVRSLGLYNNHVLNASILLLVVASCLRIYSSDETRTAAAAVIGIGTALLTCYTAWAFLVHSSKRSRGDALRGQLCSRKYLCSLVSRACLARGVRHFCVWYEFQTEDGRRGSQLEHLLDSYDEDEERQFGAGYVSLAGHSEMDAVEMPFITPAENGHVQHHIVLSRESVISVNSE